MEIYGCFQSGWSGSVGEFQMIERYGVAAEIMALDNVEAVDQAFDAREFFDERGDGEFTNRS